VRRPAGAANEADQIVCAVFEPPVRTRLHAFKRWQIRGAYLLAAIDTAQPFHVTRQPGEIMAWPIQVHSIESDKAWQISLPRYGVTFAQPISREIVFLFGHAITSTSAITLASCDKGWNRYVSAHQNHNRFQELTAAVIRWISASLLTPVDPESKACGRSV